MPIRDLLEIRPFFNPFYRGVVLKETIISANLETIDTLYKCAYDVLASTENTAATHGLR